MEVEETSLPWAWVRLYDGRAVTTPKHGIRVCVALVVLSWAHLAVAAPSVITMTQDPVNVGNVVLGASGTATGSLCDNNNDRVDLEVTAACTGAGTGTFSLTPTSNINLASAKTIEVTYNPTTKGPRQCTVNVHDTTTTTVLGTFEVRGIGRTPPAISVTGTTTFGTVRFNDAAPVHTSSQNFVVTNTGDLPLDITNVQIGGAQPGDFSITAGATTATILPDNTGTWTVTFDPVAAGSRSATLTFTSNDPGAPTKLLSLSGTGSTAVIGVDDRDFSIVNTGSSSSLDVTVQNIGAGTKGNLGVTSAAIAGGGGWFSFSACGGGTSCTFMPALSISSSNVVGVTCSPPATAAANDVQTATVTFTSDTDDAAATPDRVSNLSCTAGKSTLGTSAPMVGFPGQLVTTTSAAQSVTVTNTGNVDATFFFRLTGANASAFQAVTQSGCGTSVGNRCTVAASGGTVTFTVSFTPATEGDLSAGLDLVSASSPFPQLTVAGRGIDRHITVAPSVMFPDTFRNPGDQATVIPVMVTNLGEYPLHVAALAIAGDPVWTLAEPAGSFDVPGLGSRAVMVRFAPMNAGKMPDGMLTVTSDDRVNGTASVLLLGNGKDRRVQMAPSTIDLGDTGAGVPTRLSDVRAELLSIANLDDDHTFFLREIVIEGDDVFEVQDETGATASNRELAPGSTERYDIVFTPRTVGEFHANVTLYLDQDPSAQASIPIRGRALFVDAHGSGGCATGRGAGSGMALVLGAMLIGLRRRRAAAVVAGALFAPAASGAEPTRNINLTVFDPTPTTSGTSFQLQTAEVGARGEFVATALASYASGTLVLGTVQDDDGVVRNRTMMSIGGAYAFLGRFEAGARMPFYVQSGEAVPAGTFGVAPASGAARGDLTLHAKVRLLRASRLTVGANLALALPTASDGEFAGSDKPSARLLALLSVAASPRLTMHVNAGAVIRARAEFANIEQRSGLAWGAGLAIRVRDPWFLALEVFGDVVPSGYHAAPESGATMGATSALTTLEGLAGARYQVSRQLSVGVAGGRGLTSSIGTPDLRGVLTLAYTPVAPRTPSLAPAMAAPRDLSKADRDFDRIPDGADRCPDEPEDKDGFEDTDGCPDPDNDKDGILDEQDRCPEIAEDKDGFEDLDGCPDLDNDNDGIADASDKCPLEAETINGNNDEDGCPDAGDSLVVSTPDRLELLTRIVFTGAAIADDSANLLGQLAATLRAHTEILRLRITAHVQPTNRGDRDQAVSEKRAEAVREWLVRRGIAPDRLEVRGFGGTKPLVPANRKGAALINERFELIILERR